ADTEPSPLLDSSPGARPALSGRAIRGPQSNSHPPAWLVVKAPFAMAIKQLTPEQIHSMSLEEKDRWWLENVYRGDMPQLTLRSGLTGMFLGAFLSLTNLYVGARTGWSLGVGITSVILAFALFKVLSKIGLGREM